MFHPRQPLFRIRTARALAFGLALSLATSSLATESVQEVTGRPRKESEAGKDFESKVPSALLQMGVGSEYYSPYAFVVDKKARLLSVWTQEPNGYRKIAEFPADLGKNDGDKRSQGDHKTPEGAYWLLERLEGPTLDFNLYGSRAFTTDYPNFFDRLDGKTGNGIWLHAVPDKVPLTRGSRGCVVVRNNVIQSLTPYVRLKKTPMVVEKEIEYLPAAEMKTEADAITRWLENWRSAWERKDIDAYIAHYGESFRALKMNREQWKTYKQKLNERYQTLKVRLSKPYVLRYKDRIVVRFIQAYTSDQHQDFGEKSLYVKRTATGFEIIGEEWRLDMSEEAQQEFQSSPRVAACAADSETCDSTPVAQGKNAASQISGIAN